MQTQPHIFLIGLSLLVGLVPSVAAKVGIKQSLIYENAYYSSLARADGLSHDSVTAITQDDRGFIWLGTQAGLNRFDGHEFKVYIRDVQADTTLVNDHITALKPEHKNALWIGTLGGGSQRFDLKSERFTIRPVDSGTSLI